MESESATMHGRKGHWSLENGQNTWDKLRTCATLVFDYVPPAPPVSMLLKGPPIRARQQ